MTDRNETSPSVDELASVLAGLVGSSWQWWWAVVNELQHLPDVLRQMREGAESFEQVARQLANTTATFEQIVEVYGKAVLDAAERNAAMTDALRRQLDELSPANAAESITGAVADIQKMFGTMAALNPLWPGALGRSADDPIDLNTDSDSDAD